MFYRRNLNDGVKLLTLQRIIARRMQGMGMHFQNYTAALSFGDLSEMTFRDTNI